MAKKLKLTCWQCGKGFKGEAACVDHAKNKQHQWKPPSSLPPSSLSSASMSTAVALSLQAVTGGVPSTFVASNDIHCPVCAQQFGTWDALTMHYSVFHTDPYLTRPMLHPCAICQEFVADKRQHYMESLRHPRCKTCKEGFEDADALAQHLAARDTCDICIAHLLSSVTMNDHYRMSPIHPTCKLCSMSFRGLDEFEWHRKACPPPAAPELEAVVDTYSPPSVASPSMSPNTGPAATVAGSDHGEVDDQTDTDGAFWETTATRPAVSTSDSSEGPQEYFLPDRDRTRPLEALSTPSVETVDLRVEPSRNAARSWENGTSISNGSSADEEPPTPTHAQAPEQPFDGESAAGELDTNRDAGQAAVSWHCRSCLKDPCQDPVATMCGHVFCKRCIAVVLSTCMACPVCDKTFLIRLDVGRA